MTKEPGSPIPTEATAALVAKTRTRGTARKSKERAPESKQLYITHVAGETDKQTMARYAVSPEANAASSISVLNTASFAGSPIDLTTLMHELEAQSAAVNSGQLTRGEAMLTAQAQTLDAMFHALTRKALAQSHLAQYEAHMRLALKAQSQSRTTWEAIAEIKNPRSFAFVRQANIANGHQQINNGSGARENESTQTKLLETTRNEWMDTRAPSAPGRANQAVETLGAINGTAQ